MRKPTICGNNKVYVPSSGCTDCEDLAYRIDQIEDWINNPLTAEEIEALTPLECYEPPCADSRVCYGEACCMKVACE